MADVSKIKTPDNTTYNIKDVEGRKEENLVWGGTNIVGSVSPIGMALSNEHSANRLAFISGDAITMEYSSNGGSTWTDYGYNNTTKSQFCTMGINIPIGRPDSTTAVTTQSKTRITFTCQDGTNQYVYTNPKKMLVNVSTAKPLSMLIEYRTGTNYLNDGAWSTFGTYTLQGWSGWNDIPLILGTLGGGKDQYGNNWQLRLTISVTEVHPSYSTTAFISGVRIYGDNAWGVYNNTARTGHLYAFDMGQNAVFPSNVQMYSNKQVGWLSTTPTSGQVIVANGTGGALKTSGYTIAKSVPSDAKFTDNNTTYTFANGTNGFTVTPSGGSAQTVTVTPSITNNVTGSGTSGYLAKFNGANTITNGVQLGSDTTKFLRNDGTWQVPSSGSDVNVTQTGDNATNADFPLLFAGTADDTTRTEGAKKSARITYNPYSAFLRFKASNGVSYTDISNGQIALSATSGETGETNIHTLITPDVITLGNHDSEDPRLVLYATSDGGVILAHQIVCNTMLVSDISEDYVPSKTSGNWSIGSDDGIYRIKAYRMGNLVQISIAFHGNGNAVSSGSNGFVGAITGGALPVSQITLNGFYSSSILAATLDTDGSLTVRPFSASCTLSNASRAYLTGTFICEDNSE